jgi:hypothetical protein
MLTEADREFLLALVDQLHRDLAAIHEELRVQTAQLVVLAANLEPVP